MVNLSITGSFVNDINIIVIIVINDNINNNNFVNNVNKKPKYEQSVDLVTIFLWVNQNMQKGITKWICNTIIVRNIISP